MLRQLLRPRATAKGIFRQAALTRQGVATPGLSTTTRGLSTTAEDGEDATVETPVKASNPNRLSNMEEDDVSHELHLGRSMKPRAVVEELDRHIIGQKDAKRAVAIALRNRWRRQQLGEDLRDEVTPKNILMVGPTGCGKTEVARRLAKITDAPFIKVEATKFTEVGFHGRDVDSIIRDLVENALIMVRDRMKNKFTLQTEQLVEERILDALVGKDKDDRKRFREHLREGKLEQQKIDIEVPIKEDQVNNPMMGQNVMVIQKLGNMKRTEKKNMTIADCRPVIAEIEQEKLMGNEDVIKEAIKAVEQDGIVFVDEIDKIASSRHEHRGPDASAEGVQRDLLPLIEGSVISTKHGNVKTDHILFVASGAFHSVKPSDLLAELQGRLPIRVELKGLSEDDFCRILTEPEKNLIKQQVALIETEGVKLDWTHEASQEVAKVAFDVNKHVENIGARRLHTIIERVMEEISFTASDHDQGSTITVDGAMVRERVGDLLTKKDLSKFIL